MNLRRFAANPAAERQVENFHDRSRKSGNRIVRSAYFVTSCQCDACADRRNMWQMRGKWRDMLAVKK
jgi:hypothetical protein